MDIDAISKIACHFHQSHNGQGLPSCRCELCRAAKAVRAQLKAQQERIEELECVSGLIEDAYDDLQDAYADISMDMSGDEKEVTAAKSRNQQVKFALKVCEILSPNARKARQSLKEKADE